MLILAGVAISAITEEEVPFDKIEEFLARLMPILERKGVCVFVPNKCKKELEKHSQNKSDTEFFLF